VFGVEAEGADPGLEGMPRALANEWLIVLLREQRRTGKDAGQRAGYRGVVSAVGGWFFRRAELCGATAGQFPSGE
jgi:hypothetical protein